MNEIKITKLKADFPGRKNQIETLVQLLLEDELTNNTSVKLLLHGPPNTGKTSVLLKLLQLSSKFYVFVNCSDCYPPSLLFQLILSRLDEGWNDKQECDTLVGLVNYFKKISSEDTKLEYLILKNCSTLGESFIQAFVNLPYILSKYGWNFSIIFIDQNTSAYGASMGNHIARIFFPRYSKDELSEVMLILRPHYPREIYRNFLRVFITCVYHLYCDIFEIVQLVDVAFAHYKKPIDEERISASDLQGLYKNMVKVIKLNPKSSFYIFPQSVLPHEEYKSTELSTDLELPQINKYLLIAAYISSFVSHKHDKRLFCRNSSKRKKQSQNPLGNLPENKISSVIGPKGFTLNRLLNIFSTISGKSNYITTQLLNQVTFLVELKMIACIGTDEGNLDQPRYRCIADFDCVAAVAKSVDCDFEKYLVV